MASLMDVLRGKRSAKAPPHWARDLFAMPLTVQLAGPGGEPLVWTVADKTSRATITDQFKAGAGEYHRRYAASDHFEALFRQALAATGVAVAEAPLILDLGSGSGVNSVVPCRRLFPGARMVATDLSAELLAMLGQYAEDQGASGDILCVKMDAMSANVAPAAFDLVTGASILHHLDSPEQGLAAAGRALKPGGHAIFFEPFHGWAIIRLAFERILAEAELRATPLDPELEDVLRRLTLDIAARTQPERQAADFVHLDDKWIFSRSVMEIWGRAAGFSEVRFVPHHDHATLYRDVAAVHVRLATGRDDVAFPGWAMAILDSFDAAMPYFAKRELMVEGTIVLTKAA